jgi:hypothetical protein
MLLQRTLRAAALQATLYDEVKADPRATWQATGVVILSSLAAGLGCLTSGGSIGLVLMTMMAGMSWYVWAYITYVIGANLFPAPQTHATHRQVLRTIGFASAPGLLRLVGMVPEWTGLVFVVVLLWMLVAMAVAVRQALDYQSTLRAVGVCVLGWLVHVLAIMLVLLLLGSSPSYRETTCTDTVCSVAPRWKVSVVWAPGCSVFRALAKARRLAMLVAPRRTMTSPACKPAWAAGEPGVTSLIL